MTLKAGSCLPRPLFEPYEREYESSQVLHAAPFLPPLFLTCARCKRREGSMFLWLFCMSVSRLKLLSASSSIHACFISRQLRLQSPEHRWGPGDVPAPSRICARAPPALLSLLTFHESIVHRTCLPGCGVWNSVKVTANKRPPDPLKHYFFFK